MVELFSKTFENAMEDVKHSSLGKAMRELVKPDKFVPPSDCERLGETTGVSVGSTAGAVAAATTYAASVVPIVTGGFLGAASGSALAPGPGTLAGGAIGVAGGAAIAHDQIPDLAANATAVAMGVVGGATRVAVTKVCQIMGGDDVKTHDSLPQTPAALKSVYVLKK